MFVHLSRTENPPPYQSEGSLHKGQDSDRDSLDDYGEGPQFNEDGSFIEEYGDEKKVHPDEKDQSALATFVWGELQKGVVLKPDKLVCCMILGAFLALTEKKPRWVNFLSSWLTETGSSMKSVFMWVPLKFVNPPN